MTHSRDLAETAGAEKSVDGSIDLERLVATLEATGDYRVLRRLRPAVSDPFEDIGPCRRGIYVDVETTGLDPATDHVIELAMLEFRYSIDGTTCIAGESFEALADPGRTIPAAVTALTGITDAVVAGRSIDLGKVSAIVGKADLVVAHNAAFDRRFCERLCVAFANKPWACSYRDVAWIDEGFEGAKLGQLAAGHGLFFSGHRALDDCFAGLEVLSRPLPRSGRPALAALLESARRPRWRVRAIDAPFATRTILKARNYRWGDGSDGGPRSWYLDVDDAALDAERVFLSREIYRDHYAMNAQRVTAFDRYSERCG